MKKTIIGIDPGSRCTGYGIIWVEGSKQGLVDCGFIKTESKVFAERLLEIHQCLSEVIKQYQPDEAAIEEVFVKNNVQAALKLGQARGAALVTLAQHQLPIAEYSPRAIKKACVGYGNADKAQVQHMIKMLLNLKHELQADAADALAIALCHANQPKPIK